MWNVVQCAIQGRSHAKLGVPCQDKTCYAIDNGTYVVALADGAGTERMSHHGAEIVTRFVCLEFIEKFDVYYNDNDGVAVKQQLIERLQKSLGEKAKQLECDVKELASTLLFVAVKEHQFIIAHIGDGVIGYLRDNELRIASKPQNGEFVNTTVFTTSEDAIVSMKLIKGFLGGIKGFVLMSDGTETSLYNKKEHKLAPVLERIMQTSTIVSIDKVQEQLKHSFESVIVNETTDDCSIAMLVKANDNFKGYLHLSNECKSNVLKINSAYPKKTIKRYDDILIYLQNKHSVKQIARKIHLKPKYAKKYIDRLHMLNLIEKKGSCYRTIVHLDIGKEKNQNVVI